MKRILPLLVVGILLISAIGAGVALGKEIRHKTQDTHDDVNNINNNKFEIEAKYSYIRSYPEGGGIFIIKMTPKDGFFGYVSLKISSDQDLNTKLNKETLNKKSQIAELTIQPSELTEIKTYEIILTATYHKYSKASIFFNWINKIKLPVISYLISCLFKRINNNLGCSYSSYIGETLILEIEMFDWNSDNLPDALIKRDELIDWLEIQHPEFGTFSGKNCFFYVTYPAHLIVEHWTFLYEKWEMRICFHVMIPPHNWSMIWLRPRGEIDAIFSAKREYDGITNEISIYEYPIFYGY
jgi:hypothetical protein